MLGWTDCPDYSHDNYDNHSADSAYLFDFWRREKRSVNMPLLFILMPSFWIAFIICIIWGVDGFVQWAVIIPLVIIEMAIRSSRDK